MVGNLFTPNVLVGRQAELQQVCQILDADEDLLLAGIPGSGRRTLIRYAAAAVGSRVIEIDCLRATDNDRFLRLLAEGIMLAFQTTAERTLIQRWSVNQPIVLEPSTTGGTRLTWHSSTKAEWALFQSLLALPQAMAEWLNCRVVIVFLNFPHIRSWDRSEKWQTYLRDEIQQQSRVSYALIATVAERWVQHSNMQVVFLGPIQDGELCLWVKEVMARVGLKFEPENQALALFLSYVQGHFGDAIALARRIWLECCATCPGMGKAAFLYPPVHNREFPAAALDSTFNSDWVMQTQPITGQKLSSASDGNPYVLVQPHHVQRAALALVEDLSLTFESLILLLPPSQVRVLESLALDPTTSPHSREYIQKHQLSRGGGLQGALVSLEQKGLVYGSEYGYRITLPMLTFWLKHRLA
jgi:hypothetical protein